SNSNYNHVNKLSNEQQGVNKSNSNYNPVNKLSNEQQGVNNSNSNYNHVNKLSNEQQGVNNSNSNYNHVNKLSNKQQGVNNSNSNYNPVIDSTDNLHPHNYTSYKQHPFNNTTDNTTFNGIIFDVRDIRKTGCWMHKKILCNSDSVWVLGIRNNTDIIIKLSINKGGVNNNEYDYEGVSNRESITKNKGGVNNNEYDYEGVSNKESITKNKGGVSNRSSEEGVSDKEYDYRGLSNNSIGNTYDVLGEIEGKITDYCLTRDYIVVLMGVNINIYCLKSCILKNVLNTEIGVLFRNIFNLEEYVIIGGDKGYWVYSNLKGVIHMEKEVFYENKGLKGVKCVNGNKEWGVICMDGENGVRVVEMMDGFVLKGVSDIRDKKVKCCCLKGDKCYIGHGCYISVISRSIEYVGGCYIIEVKGVSDKRGVSDKKDNKKGVNYIDNCVKYRVCDKRVLIIETFNKRVLLIRVDNKSVLMNRLDNKRVLVIEFTI
ncbi:hypothetical protein CWI38_0800p0010, partial [Hamiltosporidium tvaerminnensis]